MHRYIIIVILFLFIIKEVYPQPGCPSIYAGADITLSCANNCTTLNASVLATGTSTSYSVFPIPYTPPYPYNTGTPILVNIDDTWSDVINLPFNFCFFGNTYNQIVAGSNGVISFDVSNANGTCPWSYTDACPSPNLILNAIYGPYHDIDPSVGGYMYSAILGAYPCRTYVVSWYDVPMYSPSTDLSCNYLYATHQIVLYESTNVIEVYIQEKPLCTIWNDGNAIIGIQDAAGTTGFTAPGRNTSQWTAYHEAWRFTPNGTPNYSIAWFQGGTQIATGPTVNICVSGNTTYTANVVYNNCDGSQITVTDNVNVNYNSVTNASVSPVNSSVCPGNPDILTASSLYPVSSYLWSTGGMGNQITVNPASNSTYTVTVTNTNGCSSTATATVNMYPLPMVNIGNDTAICAGQTITLNAGNPGCTYHWSNNSSGQFMTIPASGSYSVTVTTPNNCSSSDNINITYLPLPTPSITGLSPVCAGSTETYAAPANTSVAFSWTVSGGTIVNGNGTNLVDIQWDIVPVGSISLTETDLSTQCPNSAIPLSITINPLPIVNLSAVPDFCSADPVYTLNTGMPSGGVYSMNGNTVTTINPSALGQGNFYTIYRYTDAFGCSDTSGTSFNVYPSLV